MSSIAIVILNYKAYHETEKCIDSIINNRMDVAGIVVVDNASGNESVSCLRRKYQGNNKIKIVKSNKNLGFAKGNNLGIKVAKTLWKAEFVLLLNSDTVMLEKDYVAKLLSAYEYGTGVMQTNALRLNGRYTQRNYGEYTLSGMLFETVKEMFSYYNIYFPRKLKKPAEDTLGPWISGCDILLTPDYFKVFRGLYPLTFLYGEEYILAIMLRKAKLEWKVVEDAHILHAESKSTPADFKEGTRKKKKMMLNTKKHKIFVRVMPLNILRLIINYGKW